MARAVVATAYGGPEVLDVIEVDVADPGQGQVLLDVRAAGVNPFDLVMYSGALGSDPDKLPMRLGLEAAGVVRAVGERADGPAGPIEPGDEVVVSGVMGAYADQLVVPAANAVPRPKALTWEQAGGLLVTGAAAVHMLTATGVSQGDTVLVHGAAGGVGTIAVQLAFARGARVIGSASTARHDVLRSLGAQPVEYGEGLEERVRALVPDGVDAALDTVGTDEAIDVSLALVRDGSRIATIVAFERGA